MGEVTRFIARSGAGADAERLVRVTNENHHGFVEFQFSIGDPGLFLEMTLPPAAFNDFCREHRVRFLSEEEARAVDASERKWRYGAEDED